MGKKAGQITVLVLLLSMLALVGGLSVASRSLSDLKQSTYVDSGTRALAAAEAGLQYAFANACVGSNCTLGTQTVSAFTIPGIKTVTYQVSGVAKNAVTVPNVQKDDVVQIDFSSSGNLPSNFKGFDIGWRGSASVEIIVIDQDSGGNYSIRRYAYNASGVSRSNGFAPGLPGTSCSGGGSTCDATFAGATDSCTGFGEILYKPTTGVVAQSVRIKPLYQASDLTLCGRSSGNSQVNLSLQYYRVVATGVASDNSTRKVQADFYPAALPAVFDNVLFTGGNISK